MSNHKALFEQPTFGPAEIKLMSDVFDDAWAAIATEFNANAEQARSEMAHAIVDLAKSGQRDAERLKTYAVARTRRLNDTRV